MDRRTLIAAMGNDIISDEECAAFNAALLQADCTNVNRAAMFCAQIGHESEGLRHYEEIWGPTRDQLSYQGRMGNVHPGDGPRFKGRGPLQVTGRNNYTALSAWAFDHSYADRRDAFVAEPHLLASVQYGFLGAVWYWTTQRRLNEMSDAEDIRAATIAINGGLNGFQDRINRWNHCRSLGEALLPSDEGGFMPGEAKLVADQLVGIDFQGWVDLLGRALETDPERGRTLVEALAVVLSQLCGDPNFGGWAQLGDELKEKRTLVDGVARALELLRDLDKRVAALEKT